MNDQLVNSGVLWSYLPNTEPSFFTKNLAKFQGMGLSSPLASCTHNHLLEDHKTGKVRFGTGRSQDAQKTGRIRFGTGQNSCKAAWWQAAEGSATFTAGRHQHDC